ncbi:MAG TPA: glutamate-1-semialdehyde 2,1-aminomutase, partial [Terriglobales bacterium]|nr:glutamate-1-semialdehyde 2,1-aminomutase [Terriglobales bacterium]
DPLFIKKAAGSRIYDEDGNAFIDYVGSWGPMILGHAHPKVIAAVQETIANGLGFGAPTRVETEMADKVCELMPSIDMVRMVSSGTEATMSAIRLARAATGRKYIVKFEGCYHGHADALLVKAGSGVATFGIPGSAGVPEEFVHFTLALPYNDPNAVDAAFKQHKGEIACVIVEPVVGNMGCVPPAEGFLDALRYLTSRDNALLLFDEVMTGFRVAFGGAQELYGTRPDLTTLGKIIGGGLPVGAYGGPAEIMDQVAPLGPVYQAGTLSGNPLAMAAGLATVRHLGEHREIYGRLDRLTATLLAMLLDVAKDAGVPVTANRVGSMFTCFFTSEPVKDWASAAKCDTGRFGKFHRAMLDAGVWLPPSQFEAAFVSTAHSDDDVRATVDAARQAVAAVQG